MELGSTFSSKMPRFPTDDPDYRIIRRVPSRYLHYYFYIRDPVVGPLSMCIGTYLPFQTTYYLHGHNFIGIELRRQGVIFRKDDNAFLSTSDPKALQAAADKLSASIIEKRLNYWTWLLVPSFRKRTGKRCECFVLGSRSFLLANDRFRQLDLSQAAVYNLDYAHNQRFGRWSLLTDATRG